MLSSVSSDHPLDLASAARLLRDGQVVCYPTETFFAVGCSAYDVSAIMRVYVAKRRPDTMPLPVIIGNMDQLGMVTDISSTMIADLAGRFWPGPLSILVTASTRIPAVLTGETGRVAVRLTPHPAAQALCCEAGMPIVSTSANISGREAVTCATDLDASLVRKTAGVLDMPPAPAGGRPSTLVEIAGPGTVRVVRPGAIDSLSLQKAGFGIV